MFWFKSKCFSHTKCNTPTPPTPPSLHYPQPPPKKSKQQRTRFTVDGTLGSSVYVCFLQIIPLQINRKFSSVFNRFQFHWNWKDVISLFWQLHNIRRRNKLTKAYFILKYLNIRNELFETRAPQIHLQLVSTFSMVMTYASVSKAASDWLHPSKGKDLWP